jgi:hypothetical protein
VSIVVWANGMAAATSDDGVMDALALETVAAHWRQAFDDAEEALDELGSWVSGFPAAELRVRLRKLRTERAETDLDLRRLAGTAHLAVPPRVYVP